MKITAALIMLTAVVAAFAVVEAKKPPKMIPTYFEGSCIDPEDGDISYRLEWSSDVDGFIFKGSVGEYDLTQGKHTITATCRDNGGLVSSASTSHRAKPIKKRPPGMKNEPSLHTFVRPAWDTGNDN